MKEENITVKEYFLRHQNPKDASGLFELFNHEPVYIDPNEAKAKMYYSSRANYLRANN